MLTLFAAATLAHSDPIGQIIRNNQSQAVAIYQAALQAANDVRKEAKK